MRHSTPNHAKTLAILPFDNYSKQTDWLYFSNGFVEDLLVDLSHFSGLQIISSYTAQRLGTGDIDAVEAAREVSIDYLLKGSIRYPKDSLRITTQLLDTTSGRILWAERYDAPTDSFIEVQDRIVERVVFAIQTEVEHDLLAVARKKPVTSLEAYDCYLRGMECLRHSSLAADHEARTFFNQALKIDPHFSRAYAGLSLSHFNEWSCQLWELFEESEQNAYRYAVKAAELDDTDHVIQMILGRVYLFRRKFDEAEHHITKSLELNANDADNLVQLASCFGFLGRAAEGERLFTKALRLNPYRNLWYYQYGSFTYFVQKKYETSIELALKRQLTNVWVDLPGYIAAAYAHLGNREQAGIYLQLFRDSFQKSITRGHEPSPQEIIDWVKLANPFKYAEDTDNLVDGLLLAGLKHSPDKTTGRPNQPRTSAAIFRKEQAIWHFVFDQQESTLIDMKGLHDIRRLLGAPETDIHCTELMGSGSSLSEDDATIDSKAQRAYRQHIQDLREEILTAEEHNDTGRKAKLEEELDQLIGHLSQAIGIGHRSRKLKSPSERARAAVTLRIRNAIRKISTDHPSLAKHLANSIRTGVSCKYSPEEQPNWQLD